MPLMGFHDAGHSPRGLRLRLLRIGKRILPVSCGLGHPKDWAGRARGSKEPGGGHHGSDAVFLLDLCTARRTATFSCAVRPRNSLRASLATWSSFRL